jgi:Domain of unknown function (DUF4136)
MVSIRTGIGKLQIIGGLCATLLCCYALGVAQNVHSNYMPGTNFANFHTFKWVGYIQGGEQVNQILAQEIQDAVVSQLTGKGFIQTNADNADLYVGFQVAVQQQRQWNAFGMGGFRFGFGGMGQATSSTIEIGSLVVDIYSVANKQLVWTGTASKTVNPSGNQQKNLNNLNKGVAKLLKNFPPM